MPVISGSAVTNSSAEGGEFTPSGDFNVVVTAGVCRLAVKHSGMSEFVEVSDIVQGVSVGAVFRAGTSTRVVNHITGSVFKLRPDGYASTASAWSA